jgi:hypothetical protein
MSKTLTLTIFAKTRKSKAGREFKTYFTTLPNGEKVKAKFRRDCGEPELFPCNIDLAQGGCNLSSEKYTREVEDNKIDEATGEVVGTERVKEQGEAKVLWISAWAYSAEEYRDTSMDEFF